MGLVFADIELRNARRESVPAIQVRALADTGSLMLCIPLAIAVRLGLDTSTYRDITVADGSRLNVPYVGPIRVAFGDRYCFVGALAFGEEVLLGAVPMEDMDLIVDPKRRRVTVDPANPDGPCHRV